MAGRHDGCLQEAKRDDDGEAGESCAPPTHLVLPPPDNLGSTLLYLWLRTGRDQLRGAGEGRGATCQVKLPPTTKKPPTLLN